MKFVNEVNIRIVSCNYSPIIQPKFKQIQRKVVYLSASLSIIISLMPYHVFTDDNMDLA